MTVFYFSKYTPSCFTMFLSNTEGSFKMKTPALKPYQRITISSKRTEHPKLKPKSKIQK